MDKSLNYILSKTKLKCKMEKVQDQGVAQLFCCSQCGSVVDYAFNIAHCGYLSNYCPHCGARIENPDYTEER